MRIRMYSRMILIAAAAALIASCFTAAPAFAKSRTYKPRLLSTVIRYSQDYETKKWHRTDKKTIKYKSKYPSKIVVRTYGGDTMRYRYKYTFSKKKPKTMKKYTNGEYESTAKYNGNGKLKQINACNDEKTEQSLTLYSYHFRRYFTLKHFERTSDYSKYGSDIEYAEEDDSVRVTLRNGFLKKTVNKGLYANWTSDTPKKWERFNGVYTAYYNDRGLLRLQHARFNPTLPIGTTGPQDKFTYKWKNGRIIRANHYSWDPDARKGKGKWEKTEILVFKYTKLAINSYRYASMINAQLQESSNYYEYLWF